MAENYRPENRFYRRTYVKLYGEGSGGWGSNSSESMKRMPSLNKGQLVWYMQEIIQNIPVVNVDDLINNMRRDNTITLEEVEAISAPKYIQPSLIEIQGGEGGLLGLASEYILGLELEAQGKQRIKTKQIDNYKLYYANRYTDGSRKGDLIMATEKRRKSIIEKKVYIIQQTHAQNLSNKKKRKTYKGQAGLIKRNRHAVTVVPVMLHMPFSSRINNAKKKYAPALINAMFDVYEDENKVYPEGSLKDMADEILGHIAEGAALMIKVLKRYKKNATVILTKREQDDYEVMLEGIKRPEFYESESSWKGELPLEVGIKEKGVDVKEQGGIFCYIRTSLWHETGESENKLSIVLEKTTEYLKKGVAGSIKTTLEIVCRRLYAYDKGKNVSRWRLSDAEESVIKGVVNALRVRAGGQKRGVWRQIAPNIFSKELKEVLVREGMEESAVKRIWDMLPSKLQEMDKSVPRKRKFW